MWDKGYTEKSVLCIDMLLDCGECGDPALCLVYEDMEMGIQMLFGGIVDGQNLKRATHRRE